MIINGEYVTSGETFDVINPYSNKKVGEAPIATPDHIEKAMRLSLEAKPNLTGKKRADILRAVSIELIERKAELAEMITNESGLSVKDALYEVGRASKCAYFASIMAEKIDEDITDEFILEPQENIPKLKVITEPLDLIIGITPFNHPLNQVAHKVFPSIAAGACMVLKPSEKTPLSALKLGELLLEKGLEKNMLNIIAGTPAEAMVHPLISSPSVDMVTFTGGLDAGLSISKKMVASGNALKKYVPELGGCSSLIIHHDADMEKAVKLVLEGCFKNSGQRCTAVRRVIIVKPVADGFLDAIIEGVKKIRCGDPYDRETDMGTVISREAAEKIESRVNRAIHDGARLLLGNKREGALYPPTLLDNVNIESELVAKETFGPVCPIIYAKDIDHAIQLANQTIYRLAGAVITKSREIAMKVEVALKVGQFSWNGIPGYRTEAAPFGGFQDSGNGQKEGIVLAAQAMRRIRTFYTH